MLETMIQTEFVPLLGCPSCINIELKRFGRRNLWHDSFLKSFSTWVFNKYREEYWISTCSSLCLVSSHKTWIERCSMFHESTFSRIIIEDHETLKNNVHSVLNSLDMLPPYLETHRNNVNTIPSELLRVYSFKCYALKQDQIYSSRLTDHTFNTTTHFWPEISDNASELHDVANKIRHDS